MQPGMMFNGIDWTTGTYALPPRQEKAQGEAATVPRSDPQVPRDLAPWCNPARLEEAGWGVIVHADEDPLVMAALEPLLQHRQRLAGRCYKEIRVKAEDFTLDPDLAAGEFQRKHQIAPSGDVDPEVLPYYLLIVGGPELIPFEFQYELDIRYAVGRIFFERPEDYATYARNVVATETAPPFASRSARLFAAENDDLTRESTAKLALPLTAKMHRLAPKWDWACLAGANATRHQLDRLMGGADTPSLLLTLGHGVLYGQPDLKQRLQYQGGLLCSDWKGPGHRLFFDHAFFAKDVNPSINMRGSIAFFFSCFTAGTTQLDDFYPDDAERRQIHPFPFVSRLPMALLACERGPLAVIGHIDRAYLYSFLWDQQTSEITHFASLFYQLMEGKRLGDAMGTFNRRFAEVSAQILARQMRQGPQATDKLHVWNAWHDSRNYLVLGDPAVALPLAG